MTRPIYKYRREILEELPRHGVLPTPSTPPALVREFVTDLYRLELRKLRGGARRREFPRAELSARVVELRRRYRVVSIPLESWTD